MHIKWAAQKVVFLILLKTFELPILGKNDLRLGAWRDQLVLDSQHVLGFQHPKSDSKVQL